MKIATTVRYLTSRHHQKSLQIINTGEDVEKKELCYTVSRNVNWYSHYGEQYGGSLKKLKIELLYDPEILLVGIYLEQTKTDSNKYLHPNVHSNTIYNS